MRDYHKLDVWVEAHALTISIYEETGSFPRREMFGLTQQMRSAARSVPANIVEGCGRSSRKDFARFLDMASGSAAELNYYLELSRDLGYRSGAATETLIARASRVMRMLAGLIKTVRTSP